MTKDKSNYSNRRSFVASSAVAMAGLLGSTASGRLLAQTAATQAEAVGEPEDKPFHFGRTYTSSETRRLVLPGEGTRGGAPFAAPTGIPFWWDPDAKKLVNPTNIKFDSEITAADYQLAATLRSFRASQKDLGPVFSRLTNNAQLNINPSSVSTEGDPLSWIMMTGIKVAEGLLNKNDSQSMSLSPSTQSGATNNKANEPTAQLSSSESVVIKNGVCQLAVTLQAQRKNSFWDKLLSAVKSFSNSSIFGLLPIPKLYQTALQSITASLNQLNTQSPLTTVLGGMSYNYKLYSGANKSADLTLRSGHWVFLDSGFAQDHFDQSNNLKDVYLNIPHLLYQLTDSSNQPIDTTYVVVYLDLTKTTTSNNSKG